VLIIAQLGKAVVEFFSGDFSKAFETASAAVKGIGDEIREETKAVDGLTQATQRLRASQREIIVETAKQRAEIERLKMASDDVNRTVEQRIRDAERAAALEKRLVNERKAIAQEELRIARQKAAMTQATEEELMRLCGVRERGAVAYLRPVYSPVDERSVTRSRTFCVELYLGDSGLPETELERKRTLEGPCGDSKVLVLPDTFGPQLAFRSVYYLFCKLYPRFVRFSHNRVKAFKRSITVISPSRLRSQSGL